jgi:hypothetical protein
LYKIHKSHTTAGHELHVKAKKIIEIEGKHWTEFTKRKNAYVIFQTLETKTILPCRPKKRTYLTLYVSIRKSRVC